MDPQLILSLYKEFLAERQDPKPADTSAFQGKRPVRPQELVGHRDPRQHEFSVQLAVVEIAIEKGAASILMPISRRWQSKRPARRSGGQDHIHYYLDACDALLKALAVCGGTRFR
jgi:hypothetical protein